MSSRNVNCELERSDVGLGLRKIAQWVDYSDFTDGGSTVGTLTMSPKLPAGAIVIGSKVSVITGFTGDTTCILVIGKTSGQDEFTDGTSVSIYTAADVGESAEDPMEFIASQTTVYLYATSGSDWGLVTAGKMLVEVFYLSTEVELIDKYPNKYVDA